MGGGFGGGGYLTHIRGNYRKNGKQLAEREREEGEEGTGSKEREGCVCVCVCGGGGGYSTSGLLQCQQQRITQSITLLLAGWTGSC